MSETGPAAKMVVLALDGCVVSGRCVFGIRSARIGTQRIVDRKYDFLSLESLCQKVLMARSAASRKHDGRGGALCPSRATD
jgi:hypothetical protein